MSLQIPTDHTNVQNTNIVALFEKISFQQKFNK